MSKTGRPNYRRSERERNRRAKPEKRVIVEEVQRERPDLKKLSRAIIGIKADEKKDAVSRDNSQIDDSQEVADDA